MKLDNILFGVVGLLAGLIIGFVFANSVNKSPTTTTATQMPSNSSSAQNPALPKDHPPLGTSPGSETATGAQPQIMEAIEKAKKETQNFEAQMTAADLYYQIQRFDEATTFYEAAVKLKPNDNEAIIKLGNALFDSEKYVEAEKWYSTALQKDPKNIGVRTDLGLSFFLRKPPEFDKALKEFNAALAIDPAHEITLQNIGLVYKDQGDKENLKATIDKLKAVNAKNPALPRLESGL